MTEEKPLHVRVAEALGCKPKQSYEGSSSWDCTCAKPAKHYGGRPHSEHLAKEAFCHDGEGLGCDDDALARYDTDWSATGPLIEKYEISVGLTEWDDQGWEADKASYAENGATPLVAVCNLILALKEAGKL